MLQYENKSPEKLIQLLLQEDADTITWLLRKLQLKTSNTLKNKGLTNEDIEEVLIDTILIFIEKLKNKEFAYEGKPIICYLVKITKFRSYKYINRSIRQRKLDECLRDIVVPSHSKLPPSWELVEMALDQISDRERQLIELSYFQGYKDKELIDHHQIDYSTIDSIKTQRYKCIQKLKRIVKTMQ